MDISSERSLFVRKQKLNDAEEVKSLVLFVDDEVFNQLTAQSIIESLGYSIINVSNGQEAVDAYKERPKEYGIIFMDWEMPKLDGVETTKEIRKYEKEQKQNGVAIVMISGHEDSRS